MPSPLDRLLPPGLRAIRTDVPVGGRSIALYTVSDPNALADAVDPRAFEEDERFPYWAELWPSSVALATFLLRHGAEPGVEALELGCGLGLVGVAAALVGAQVLFTDFEADALAFAGANHALNLGSPGHTRLLDWRTPPVDLSAQLVLAADVLYERRFFDPFLRTLGQLLRPGGRALVAEPGRDIASGTLESLEQAGLRRELHLEEVVQRGRTHAVWIHEFRARP